jgi:serine/threonine-protein kinase
LKGTEEPYFIERRLAAGGMAEVFVAKRVGPHGFEKRVALKRILPQFAVEPDFVHMFIDEARLAARLDHANVVQVFDFGKSEGTFYIAMELVDGSNVNHLLRGVAMRDEAVPVDIALHIAIEAARALGYAHALCDDEGRPLRLVHRDVSPANLLLTRDGHVKLGDFGIARAATYEARTQTGQLRGKLGYMSPEQVLGRALDGRSDVFTLTTILAEMLIAEPLFGKGTDIEVLTRIRDVDLSVLDRTKRHVPKDVRAALEQGFTKEPEQRPDASAFLRILHDVAQRRGASNAAGRLTQLMIRIGLIEPRPGDPSPNEPSLELDLSDDLIAYETSPARPDELRAPRVVAESATYRARTEIGQLGPMSYSQLVELILSGRVDADTMVSRAGAPFERASDVPELSRFLSSPTLQWQEREVSRACMDGRLGRAALIPLVHKLVAERETGLLYLASNARRKKIYFVEGRPVFVASTDRNELLGEYLVNTGTCLRMELDMALAVLPRYDGRLGDALVGLGILRPITLVQAIQAQARKRLLEAFAFRAGTYRFVRGASCEEELFGAAPDTCELLRDAIMATPDKELEAALEGVHHKRLRRLDDPPLSLRAYRLPPSWNELIAGVRGDATLDAVVARWASEPLESYRALYLGLSCQLIEAVS